MVTWYRYLPDIMLSRVAGALASSRCNHFKNFFIRQFAKHYKITLDEANVKNFSDFPCFQDFFIRELQPGARTIDQNSEVIVSPVDGCISEYGKLKGDDLLQAKRSYYSSAELLGGDKDLAASFNNGLFMTLYLAPHNYHRVHMPYSGKLRLMRYIPGRLMPVKPSLVKGMPGLFSHNERVVCIFDGDHGPFAVVLVGAMIVGKIATSWHGMVRPKNRKQIQTWEYGQDNQVHLNKGDECGYFALGSSVVMLFPDGQGNWIDGLQADQPVVYGEKLAKTS